jgi:CsoR family transcriptional regulator, copper-sensing transcriptional repressor
MHRLKIVRGHLDKIIDMVEKDGYCLDITQQTQAVQSSLGKVNEIILEHHLKTCVKDAMKNNSDVNEKIEEIMQVFRRK